MYGSISAESEKIENTVTDKQLVPKIFERFHLFFSQCNLIAVDER